MDTIQPLGLLSLIIALSAYISSIRLTVLARLPTCDATTKVKLQRFLKLLTPADISLVSAGILLFLDIFWQDLFRGAAPQWFSCWITWLFFIGVLTLAIHHIAAWYKTFRA